MMFERKLGKIGINKGILFGILFMLLVLGVLVSVKMVMGAAGDMIIVPKAANIQDPATQIDLDTAKLNLGQNGVQLGDDSIGATINGQQISKGGATVDATDLPEDSKISFKDGKANVELPNGQTATGNTVSYNSLTEELSAQNLQDPTKSVSADSSGSDPAKMRCNQPKGPGDQGDPSGKGGSGSGQGLEKEAFAAAQQVMGLAAQIGEKIKEAAKKQPNPPNIFYPQEGEVATTVENGAIATVQDKDKTVSLAQNNVNLPGDIKGTTLKDFTTGNSIIVVYGSLDAILVTPPNKRTHVINDLSEGNPALTNTPSSSNEVNTGGIIQSFLPFFKMIGFVDAASADVTGNAIISSPDQEIKLKGYDLGVGGEDLIVAIFKPFDKVNGRGINLEVYDGNVSISFKNLKTYYPRTIQENEFFINEIRNDYDNKNVFMLVPEGAKGNYFEDARHRLTVGDAVVKNPLEGYEKVMIPATRLAMWKKAVDGDVIE